VQDFSNMVADPHFVPDAEYVGGLVDRIPIRKQGDTLISLYREINWKQSTNFQMVIRELISRLPDSEIDDFMSVVSEDLLRVEQVGSATLVIKVLPNELWPRIQRMSRLRIEKILLDELENAWYIPDSKRTNSSASTWISAIAEHYIRKYRLRGVIINKLKKKDFDHHNFVARYLMAHDALPHIFEEEQHIKQCVSAIAESIRSGNEFMKNSLVQYIMTGPPPGWKKKFLESLNDLTDPDNPEVYLYDGTPFLGKFVPRPNPVSEPIGEEEELPF
jgi:hypothetical protein